MSFIRFGTKPAVPSVPCLCGDIPLFLFFARKALLISDCKTFFFTLQSDVRLDLFLKACRLVKRRAVARELCEAGRVLVNGQESKPAKEVRYGDRVLLRFSTKNVEIEVLDLPVSSKKFDPGSLYRVTAETKVERRDNA